MCGAHCDPARLARVHHRPRTRDPAHAREVDANDVDRLAQEERFGVVAAALLVAHRDRDVGPLAQAGDDLGVARREDVLEPREPRVAYLVQEREASSTERKTHAASIPSQASAPAASRAASNRSRP